MSVPPYIYINFFLYFGLTQNIFCELLLMCDSLRTVETISFPDSKIKKEQKAKTNQRVTVGFYPGQSK